jgi:hypothetical protein
MWTDGKEPVTSPWKLYLGCAVASAVLTVVAAQIALGGGVVIIFYGATLVSIITRSKRIRWAALISALTTFVTLYLIYPKP